MTIDHEKLFKDCCSIKTLRYAIGSPWVKGGYRCATDGRICVRMRTDEPDTKDVAAPSIKGLFWNDPPGAMADMPDTTGKTAAINCPLCNASGVHWCQTCESDHECGYCEGGCEPPNTETLPVGDTHHIGVSYAILLASHGVTEIECLPNRRFRCKVGDAEILLMGCDKRIAP